MGTTHWVGARDTCVPNKEEEIVNRHVSLQDGHHGGHIVHFRVGHHVHLHVNHHASHHVQRHVRRHDGQRQLARGLRACFLKLFLQPSHEFNSALEDNQEVLDEESWRSSSSEDGEEGLEEAGEVTAEEDLMYRDEMFEEGEVGTTDDRRAVIENENLSAEVLLDDSRQTEEVTLEAHKQDLSLFVAN